MDFASSSSATAPPANREHMFEKVVTPSDVGKLNRLVIPKQHAEKYFPLDSAAGEKGLLLNFDESGGSGKSWRFRYSYWSSSQSYVITKGWSRFVKDKQLFAGDVVSFFRGPADGRFFIDWRRRPSAAADHHGAPRFQHHPGGFSLHRPIVSLPHHQYQHHPGWCYTIPSVSVSATPLVGPTTTTTASPYNYGYGPSLCQFGGGVGPTRFVQTASLASDKAAAAASPKRLRLFGVNMDCHVTSPSSTAPHGGFCDQIPSASSSTQSAAAASLQLRLDLSSSAAVDFLDRGKSSPSPLSFDFGV